MPLSEDKNQPSALEKVNPRLSFGLAWQGLFGESRWYQDIHESIFSDFKLFGKDNTIEAEVKHLDGLPTIAYYTNDPDTQAKASAKLLAQQFFDFFGSYLQHLPYALQSINNENGIKIHPITYIRQNITKRQLNYASMEPELKAFFVAINGEINKARKGENKYKLPEFLKTDDFEFTDLLAVLMFADVYKGIDGCSAAVRKVHRESSQGKQTNGLQLLRNLDWASLGKLGSNTLGVLKPTKFLGHDTSKPQATFSLAITPGLLGFSYANDKGLVITLNEVTSFKSKRENEDLNAVPQFILLRQIAENCSTVDEALEFIKSNQPCTSHILAIMDAKGSGGVIEMLPIGQHSEKLYNLRFLENADKPYVKEPPVNLDKRSNKTRGKNKQYGLFVLATNDFRDDANQQVKYSGVWDCSEPRYQKLSRALEKQKSSKEALQKCVSSDTVQSMRFTQDEDKFRLTVTWANSYAAVDPESIPKDKVKDPFSRVDLKLLFNEFLGKLSVQQGVELTEDKYTSNRND